MAGKVRTSSCATRLLVLNVTSLASTSKSTLSTLGITHVVSVCPDLIEVLPMGTEHLRVEVEDHEYADLLSHLPRAITFIQDALDGGGRVLVHCRMGISRSATVLAAWRTSSSFRNSIAKFYIVYI